MNVTSQNNPNNFGDKIYSIIKAAMDRLFFLGEMYFLTTRAYEEYINKIDSEEEDSISISYPISYRGDLTSLMSNPRDYSKDDFKGILEDFKLNKLSVYGVYQMVTIIELLLNDLLRLVLFKYPQKISSKKKIEIESILSAASLNLVKFNIIDSVINEIS